MRQFLLTTAVLLALATTQAQQIPPSTFADLHWRSIGPPRSGYVSAPAGVPGDPTTYYVGLPEGGVWKTTNGGDDVEADLRRRARRVDRRGGRGAVRSERSSTSAPATSPAGRSRSAKASTSRPTAGRRGRTSACRARNTSAASSSIRATPTTCSSRRSDRARRERAPADAARPPGRRRTASAACIARPTAGGRGRACCRPTARPARPTSISTTAIRRSSTRCSPAAPARLRLAGRRLQIDRRRRDLAAGRRPRPRPTARASPRSRCRRARTAGGSTRSRRSAADAARGGGGQSRAVSIGRRRRELDVRHARNSPAPAARFTRIRRIPTSCISWARRSIARSTAASTSPRSGARRAAPIRASSGSIPTNSKRMLAGVDQGPAISVDGGAVVDAVLRACQRPVLSRRHRLRLSVSRLRPAAGFRHRVRREPQRLRRDPAERLVSRRRVRERLSDRRSARQALHVHAGLVSRAAPLRSHDRPGRRALSADGRRSLRRRAAARVLAAGSAHALHGGAATCSRRATSGQTWRAISPDLTVAASAPAQPDLPPAPGSARAPAAAGGFIQALALVAGYRRRDLGRHEHRLDPGHARRRQDRGRTSRRRTCRRPRST